MGRTHNNGEMKMQQVNSHHIIGEIAYPPKAKTFDSGSRITEFSVKANKSTLRVKCWNEAADASADFKVGDVVDVTGEVKNRSYEKDGAKVWVTETVVNDASGVALMPQETGPKIQWGDDGRPVPDADGVPF